MSRLEKHKTKKDKRPEVFWIVSFIFYALFLYLFVRYVTIQSSISFLETLEIGLFFCTILFLDLYLLAFTFLSTKISVQQAEKTFRAKYSIIAAWVGSLLYHFVLWLMSPSFQLLLYYQAGVAITLGALVFTLAHFCIYFSSVKDYHRVESKSRYLENRREAYELLQSILYMYNVMSDVVKRDPEVGHMMRWNQFDTMLEQMVYEAQPYVQAVSFSKEDLEKLIGVKLWMENMLMIIEQHPTHKNILKEAMK